MPPFSRTLEVTFTPEVGGTRFSIVHSGLPDSETPRHALDWTHCLGRLRLLGTGRELEPHFTPASPTEGAD